VENKELTEFCGACFDRKYPTGDITSHVLAQIERERSGVHKSQMDLNI